MNNTTDKKKSNSFQGNANTPLLSSQSLPPTPSSSPPLEKKRLTLKLNINRENLSARLPVNIQIAQPNEAKDQNLTKEKAGNNLSNIKSKDNTSTKEYAANNFKNEVSTEENPAVTSSDKTSKDKAQDKDKKTKKDKKPKPPPKPQIVHPKAKMKPDEYVSVLKTLQKKFPKAFNRKPVLLKINIHQDLLENTNINITRIRSFLNLYCNTKRYKKNYVFGRERFDLNGEVAGTYDIVKETKKPSEVKNGQELNNSSASQKTEGTKKSDNTKEVGELKSQENKNAHQNLQNNKPQPSSQHNKPQQSTIQNKSQIPYHQQNKNIQNSPQQVKSQSPSQPLAQQNKLQQPKFQQNYQPLSQQSKSQPSQQSYQTSSQQNKYQQSAQQNKPKSQAQQNKLAKYALFEKEMLGKF